MKKIFLVLTLIVVLFLSEAITSLPANAKSKKQTSKKFTKKGKKSKNKKSHSKKQTLEQSLNKLEQFFPAYSAEKNEFDVEKIASMDLKENTAFLDNENRIKLLENINEWLTTPYRHAGRSKNGVDCSNFTSVMVNNALGIKFPSSPETQSRARNVEYIKNIDDLQFGDLIFFTGRNRNAKRLGHVGFYIGNGLFAHSSSGRGVIYTHISESYYTPRFRGGGRIIDNSIKSAQAKNSGQTSFIKQELND